MDILLEAVALVCTPYTLAVIFGSAAFGLFVGAMPGLTATMATALLVPLTFYMDPVPAIAAIVACTAMAITAGDLPGALLRIPGTPASAAYTDEAYAMTRRGLAGQAIGISLVASTLGGLIGFTVLLFTAPLLARVALNFSSFEYFWLALLGLSCAALVSSGGVAKGVLALLLGLFISTVGMDPLIGSNRFTFGSTELTGGISFIPAMIGMFALSEILRASTADTAKTRIRIGNPFKGMGALLKRYAANLMRGSAVGTAIGALPGAGGDLGAWISYAVAKRSSKTPEKFGKGHPEGLVEACSTNNAALSSAWIPAMVFGVPGDAVTAIAVGVLVMKGMNPGPQMFSQSPENFYAVMIAFVIANLLILPFGYVATLGARWLFRLRRSYLNGGILLFCIVGSYAINNSTFGIVVMLALGLMAFVLEDSGFPLAPVILGIVLGPLLEKNFLTSMIIARGDVLGFFERPIAAGLGILTLLVWLTPLCLWLVRRLAGKRKGRDRAAFGRTR